MSEDELILTHILKCSRSDLHLQKPQLTAQQQKQFEECKRRRQNDEPLQYILGVCDFMGFELKVDHRVLIPRPETEVLVDHAIKILNVETPQPLCFAKRSSGGVSTRRFNILDLGTGSGNIAIALARLVPNSLVTTVDIFKDALNLAKENAQRHGVEERINFVCGDMFEFLEKFEIRNSNIRNSDLFDLIISNPPYIPKAQMKILPRDIQQEPPMALEAGSDGMRFLKAIIKFTPPLLRTSGYLMMEFGDACLQAGGRQGQSKPI